MLFNSSMFLFARTIAGSICRVAVVAVVDVFGAWPPPEPVGAAGLFPLAPMGDEDPKSSSSIVKFEKRAVDSPQDGRDIQAGGQGQLVRLGGGGAWRCLSIPST